MISSVREQYFNATALCLSSTCEQDFLYEISYITRVRARRAYDFEQ